MNILEEYSQIPQFEQNALAFRSFLDELDKFQQRKGAAGIWIYRDTLAEYIDKSVELADLQNKSKGLGLVSYYEEFNSIISLSLQEVAAFNQDVAEKIYSDQDEADKLLNEDKCIISFTWNCPIRPTIGFEEWCKDDIKSVQDIRDLIYKKVQELNGKFIELEEKHDSEDNHLIMHATVLFS